MARPGSTMHRSYTAAAPRPSPHRTAPPAVTTNSPTPQFRQHHQVQAPQVDGAAFRQGWRVATRLDGLLEAGRIDREQWDAAAEWRRWAEVISPMKAQSWDLRIDTPLMPNDAGMLFRVNAASKLRACIAAIGELRIRLLECCVLRDRSWAEVGQAMRVSDKTAKDYVVEALGALADWRAGRSVAPPPMVKYRNEPRRL
jgi:hypothetical protein